MIRNAFFVEGLLNNWEFGKRAQSGYDLSLKSLKRIAKSGIVCKDKTTAPDYVDIMPVGEYYDLTKGVYSVTFNEGGAIPLKCCGWIKTRSSLVRCGSVIESGLYDPGFSCAVFGAMLFVDHPIKIEKNSRIAQLIIFESEESELYDGQWQKEKDKK